MRPVLGQEAHKNIFLNNASIFCIFSGVKCFMFLFHFFKMVGQNTKKSHLFYSPIFAGLQIPESKRKNEGIFFVGFKKNVMCGRL